MAKINPTLKHIADNAVPVISGPNRLLFPYLMSKQPVTYRELAMRISEKNLGTVFFLDTNFFTAHEIEDAVWTAIFDRTLTVTRGVHHELKPWLATPFYNKALTPPLSRTSLNEHIVFEEDMWQGNAFYSYYVNLLLMRKRRGQALVEDFVQRHGRQPTADEQNNLFNRGGLERDRKLLQKGFKDIASPNFFTDEELVTSAVLTAILTGRDSVILTRDPDLLEQFEKLLSLLTKHYIAHCFANIYAESKSSFETKGMRQGHHVLDFYFDATESLLVKKHVSPELFVEAVLPNSFEVVRTTCLLFGGQPPDLTVTPLPFRLERGMADLLMAVGNSFGLCTDRLQDKNCHATGFPIGIDDPDEWVIVSKDNMRSPPDSPLRFAEIDVGHVITHRSRYKHLTPTP